MLFTPLHSEHSLHLLLPGTAWLCLLSRCFRDEFQQPWASPMTNNSVIKNCSVKRKGNAPVNIWQILLFRDVWPVQFSMLQCFDTDSTVQCTFPAESMIRYSPRLQMSRVPFWLSCEIDSKPLHYKRVNDKKSHMHRHNVMPSQLVKQINLFALKAPTASMMNRALNEKRSHSNYLPNVLSAELGSKTTLPINLSKPPEMNLSSILNQTVTTLLSH